MPIVPRKEITEANNKSGKQDAQAALSTTSETSTQEKVRTGFTKLSFVVAIVGTVIGILNVIISIVDGQMVGALGGLYLIAVSVGIGVIAEISLNVSSLLGDIRGVARAISSEVPSKDA